VENNVSPFLSVCLASLTLSFNCSICVRSCSFSSTCAAYRVFNSKPAQYSTSADDTSNVNYQPILIKFDTLMQIPTPNRGTRLKLKIQKLKMADAILKLGYLAIYRYSQHIVQFASNFRPYHRNRANNK